MRTRLEDRAISRLAAWQRSDPRVKHLCLMDMYLDGKIYDGLPREFDEESIPSPDGIAMPRQIAIRDRKPSTRLCAAKTAARNVARKLFAGRHAPSLICDGHPEAVLKIQKFLKEGSVQKEMIGLVVRGSVGSVCATYKVVNIAGQMKLVFTTHRAAECFPFFDASKELECLYIVREVKGSWFIAKGVRTTAKGDSVEDKLQYFYVRMVDKNREVFFKPVLVTDWNPTEGFSKLVEITDGPLAPTQHDLGFVQAQWFVNMSGGEFPDGDCLFEPALDNIVTYDYNLSQMDLGLKNAATPVTVIRGNLVQYTDEDGKALPRPATRYLHFEGGTKDPDGISEEGGDAHLMESTGQGFLADLKFLELLKKNISEQISSSRKDPDKVTTAMSGAGIELIEEEFMDLVFELRTCYGEDGYLKLVKKMCRSGINAEHKLLQGVTEEMVDELDLGWPDLHDLSPQDYQQFTAGLLQAESAGVIDQQQAHDLHRAKIDVPVSNVSKRGKKAALPAMPQAQTAPTAKASKRSSKTKEKSE